jgi:hypothetical protein
VVERKWVLVQDQIKCSPPAEVWWFLHTPATIELRDNGRNALLAIGEVQLLARIQSPTRARFTVRDTVPLPTSPNPQGQESSPEVRKLSIHLENVEDEVLAVVLVPLWKGRPENWSPPPVRLEDW